MRIFTKWFRAPFCASGLLLLACLVLNAQDNIGQLRGRVIAGRGSAPVAGAVVTATRLSTIAAPILVAPTNPINDPGRPPTPAPMNPSDDRLPELFEAIADASGRFEFTALIPGNYRICARSVESGFLDPCAWHSGPPLLLPVAAGQQIVGHEITMLSGREFELIVADSTGVLEQNQSRGTGVDLVVGVWGPGGQFQPALLKLKLSTSRTYSVTVPFDTPLRLNITGRRLVMEDESGKRITATDTPQAVIEPTSALQSARQFRFVVKSLEP